MKAKITFILLLLIVVIANGQNTWMQKANFGGTARNSAVGFSIGTKGYILTGWDGSYKNDLWEYDPESNLWTQKANFPGTARYAAVGFSIGTKGYIGTGRTNSPLKDFWEYDPGSNTWTQKAELPGVPRDHAVGFNIGNKGYIGLGASESSSNGCGHIYLNDFWEYDPIMDSWVQKASFGGTGRTAAVGFVIGSKAYVGMGAELVDCGGIKQKDMWEYDQTYDTWIRKADFTGSITGRPGATSFSIGAIGYVGMGEEGGPPFFKNDFWEYNPSTNSWTQVANFGGMGRIWAPAFSIGIKGYVGTGFTYNGAYNNVNDFWEYTPCIQFTSIPDTNFEKKLIALGIDSDGMINGQILTSDAANKTGTLHVSASTISDLTGIEAFVNITRLNCDNNSLTNLDVSANTALKILQCYNNALTFLDVSNNHALIDLRCGSNLLTSLNVNGANALQILHCYGMDLTSLDVSNNFNLLELNCSNNSLTNLDVSENVALTSLICDVNPLGNIDVSTNTALEFLACTNNALSNLDVGNNTSLTFLSCGTNSLASLDVSTNNSLTYLECIQNSMINLNVSGAISLNILNCSQNSLINLDVSTNTQLQNLYCASNSLTNLDVSTNTALKTLSCGNNSLTNLNVSANIALTNFECGYNSLNCLDFRNGFNQNVYSLFAKNNPYLTCISVDDSVYSTNSSIWESGIDVGVILSENCNIVHTTTITCLENQVRSTDPGEYNYTVQNSEFDPTVNTDCGSIIDITNNYNNSSTLSNAVFPIGTTTVAWTVRDTLSYDTARCSFDVTVYGPCPSVIYLYSQADVDSFQYNYPNCANSQFSLIINGADIVDLNPLYGHLPSILNDLKIQYCIALTSLDGLEGINSISGELSITGNSNLTSLSGLDNLTSIGFWLDISNNISLTSISELNNLNSIGEHLIVSGCPLLTSLTGLEGLTIIPGILYINYIDSLTSLIELSNLVSVGGLSIGGNATLNSLTGLENITSTVYDVYIGTNPSLTSFAGLNGLKHIGGILDISQNNSLFSLSGLDSLYSVGRLNMDQNNSLTSLSGLDGLRTISNELIIIENESLNSLSGLEDLTSLQSLYIYSNGTSLTKCDIQSICTFLNNGGTAEIFDNGFGCNSAAEVIYQCSNTITPTITCVDNQTRSTNEGVYDYTVQNTEFDPIAYAGSVSGASISNSYNNSSTLSNAVFPIGTTTVAWTVRDTLSYDTARCSFDVTVEYNDNPIITCPNDIEVYNDNDQCGATMTITEATAIDNDGVQTIIGVRSDSLSLTDEYPVGSNTIIWTAYDSSGNSSVCFQNVSVEDNEVPTWTTTLDSFNRTVYCGQITLLDSAQALVPIAVDNCTESVLITKTIGEFVSSGTNGEGSYTNTWTATDDAGNVSVVFQQVITALSLSIDASASSNPVQVGSSATLIATVSPEVANIPVEFKLDNGNGGITYYDAITNGSGIATTIVEGLPAEVYLITATAQCSFDGAGGDSLDQDIPLLAAINFPSYSSAIAYLPVYDPTGGYITGGGWINSPVGAYPSNPGLTGKANFGFVAKYKKGNNQVDGNTEFQFNAGNLNFKSTLNDAGTLVISGSKATFRGIGTVNGSGNFGFLLAAVDGQISGGGGFDKFRIKIWDKAQGNKIVYDNQMNALENADATTVIAGGSIVIHEEKKNNLTQVLIAEASKNDMNQNLLVNQSNDGSDIKLTEEITEPSRKVNSESSFLNVKAYPNPTENNFTLLLKGGTNEKIVVLVYDALGLQQRLIEIRNCEEHISFGEDLKSGMYLVAVRQGSNRKTIKLVKL